MRWFLILATCATVRAPELTLAWDPNPETNVAGYVLYLGTASRNYGEGRGLGLNMTEVVGGLGRGITYYFAVTAYDDQGAESGPSNEVSHRFAPAAPGDVRLPPLVVEVPMESGGRYAIEVSTNLVDWIGLVGCPGTFVRARAVTNAMK